MIELYFWKVGPEWTFIMDHPEPNAKVTEEWLTEAFTTTMMNRQYMINRMVIELGLSEDLDTGATECI